jgi:hypothetical protein
MSLVDIKAKLEKTAKDLEKIAADALKFSEDNAEALKKQFDTGFIESDKRNVETIRNQKNEIEKLKAAVSGEVIDVEAIKAKAFEEGKASVVLPDLEKLRAEAFTLGQADLESKVAQAFEAGKVSIDQKAIADEAFANGVASVVIPEMPDVAALEAAAFEAGKASIDIEAIKLEAMSLDNAEVAAAAEALGFEKGAASIVLPDVEAIKLASFEEGKASVVIPPDLSADLDAAKQDALALKTALDITSGELALAKEGLQPAIDAAVELAKKEAEVNYIELAARLASEQQLKSLIEADLALLKDSQVMWSAEKTKLEQDLLSANQAIAALQLEIERLQNPVVEAPVEEPAPIVEEPIVETPIVEQPAPIEEPAPVVPEEQELAPPADEFVAEPIQPLPEENPQA